MKKLAVEKIDEKIEEEEDSINEGKDVFAVPGNITSNTSKGTNALIKDGAKVVMNISDILEEYEHYHNTKVK